jgi:DNA-binding transcriptional regulator YdaS (Cro superfamily)
MTAMPDIEALIERAGGPAALAEAAGVTRTTVYSWRKRGRVPAKRAADISDVLAIPRHAIRPDLWPPPEERK